MSEFRKQSRNANKHTQRGLTMLEQSIKEGGFIGAITAAADGEVFDGSARLDTVSGMGDPIVIDADGTRPIIVRRIDIPSADDPKAKKLAIAANRVAEIDLAWDTEILLELNDEIDLEGLFDDEELEAFAQSQEESFDETEYDSSAKEIDVDAFEFDCECPKCGFQFTKVK